MNKLQANIALLVVTLCWSTEVIIFSVIPNTVPPFATTCITSLIGAVVLVICFARRIVVAFREARWKLFRRVLLLSILNTAYNTLYLIGLDYFDVSSGAFTLSMTVVVIPVLLLVMRRGVDIRTWISAALVFAGILVVLLPTAHAPQIPGLAAIIIGCVLRAIYIVKLGDYAREHDPISIAASMVSLNAIISFVPWCAMEPTTFFAIPWNTEVVASLFIYSYFIVCFATTLNNFAQRRASAAEATIVYATEIVFSTIWAVCLPDSIVDSVALTPSILIGCMLVVCGNLVQLVGNKKADQGQAGEQVDHGEQPATERAALGEQLALVSDGQPATAQAARGEQPATTPATSVERDALRDASQADDASASLVAPKAHMFPNLSPLPRAVVLFVILLGAYLAISLPFKVLSVIPGFTDVRPVGLLMPAYGIFFGLPGCLAFATGNLIGDIFSDSLRISSIAGFVANFLYPYVMYVFWTKLRKRPFALRTGREMGLMALLCLACACMQALIITPAVAFYYPDVDTALFVISVVSNSAAFPICFGIPLIALMQEELGFEPLS